MAKTVSSIFKFKGSIGELTFVKSKAYGPHVRRRKGTVTPFEMTPALLEGKDRLHNCNQHAKLIFQALRDEPHDGSLWSRILSIFFRELKAGRTVGVDCLKDLECNLKHTLDGKFQSGYNISVTTVKKKMRVQVQLNAHPIIEDTSPRKGYQLRVVVIYPDFVRGTFQKEVVMGQLTQYGGDLPLEELPMPMPSAKAPYVVLLGMMPYLQGEGLSRVESDAVMKVVLVSSQL